ncbi:MAG: aminotransferase class I/II-fold pyridoxal phosphate-dependent enzyme [Planctomycetota bacterium]
MDTNRLIADRSNAIDASGIRKIFALAADLRDPINLSIGQPDFEVPPAIRDAARDAIDSNQNGYSPSQGAPALLERTIEHLRWDLGWDAAPAGRTSGGDDARIFVSSGTSGALTLAFLALLNPGDECVIPDPYFVSYPHLATLAGARAVCCDTYPDFRMTAERVEPLLNERTRFVLLNSPGNPSGVVTDSEACDELRELCRSRGVLLISDEIYDEFTFAEALSEPAIGDPASMRCPSPARRPGAHEDTLVIRGFGKTYGVTGWRLGYAAGPAPVVEAMAKLQQYTFVCAPTPLQAGVLVAFDTDMRETVARYRLRRDMVIDGLAGVADVTTPGGAFYAFVPVPERTTGTRVVERLIEREVLTIPGAAFSLRDTHLRISYAAPEDKVRRGVEVLRDVLVSS